MKILLINPDNPPGSGRDLYHAGMTKAYVRSRPDVPSAFGCPLALTTLAALTPREHKVRIVDEAVESIRFDTSCDLVGITAMTFKAKRAYDIAARFRARGIPVVMGGIHASMCPAEAADYVDSVVIGEADDLWSSIVEDASRGQLKPCYTMNQYPDLSHLPAPRYRSSRFKRYLHMYLQTARGCPFDCSFCTVTKMCGRKMRFKTPEQVVAEFESVVRLRPGFPVHSRHVDTGRFYSTTTAVFFVDDNFAVSRDHAFKVCEALREFQEREKLFIEWFTQVNFKVGLDHELLETLSVAGCRQLFMGFESQDPDELRRMNKPINDPRLYQEAVRNSRRHGIEVVYSTIIGTDSDTPASIEKTADFIEENDVVFVLPNIMTPYPGTRLRDEMVRTGRVTSHDWNLYNIRNVVFCPKKMTAEELYDSYRQFCRRVLSYDAMIRRGRRALNERKAFHRVFLPERFTIVVLFVLTTVVFVVMRRLSVSRAWRLILGFSWDFVKHGTIESAWALYSVAADYGEFAESEWKRLDPVKIYSASPKSDVVYRDSLKAMP